MPPSPRSTCGIGAPRAWQCSTWISTTATAPRTSFTTGPTHGDPAHAFPYFAGYADETGTGPGTGYTMNLPLPPGCGFPAWSEALTSALDRIRRFGPDALVVSLGVDTFEQDPISFFRLKSEDFSTYGGMIGRCGWPTLFVFEGGYAVAEVGVNAVNVLTGFESG
jgi:acetoin utilization deacetylase AcuC-like enzyme